MEKKVTKIDARGRITIPMEYRKYFPEESRVTWLFDGTKLVVHFEGKDEVEYLTDEYLQNQILDLQGEVKKIRFELGQLRKMAFTTLVKPPESDMLVVDNEQ